MSLTETALVILEIRFLIPYILCLLGTFLLARFILLSLEILNCQIKLDFSSNSEKLGRVIDNSMIS